MKGGQKPIHIQRWAPADLHSDEHWKLLEARRDYRTMHFYRVFMDHAFMLGGDLPADPTQLAAVVRMPARDVVEALKFCVGRLLYQDADRLFQKRVRREVKKELRFRRGQSALGKLGGRPRIKGEPKGTLLDSKSPPAPLPYAGAVRRTPTPAPTPPPSPTLTPRESPNAGDLRAGGGRSNGGPPAPPASASRWVLDHDASNPLEASVASKVAHLASLTAERDGDADAFEILAAVSTTPAGNSLDHIRGAPAGWLGETVRACDRFESDNFSGDEPRAGRD